MNPQAPDLPLRDIHLPASVSWWPLAPGWWMVLILAVLIPLVILWLRKRRQKIIVKKAAASALHAVLQDYAQHQNQGQLLRELTALCRRIALSYYPREQVAGITGAAWMQTLNQLTAEPVLNARSQQLLTQGAYMASLPEDVDPLIEQIKTWIDQLPAKRELRPC